MAFQTDKFQGDQQELLIRMRQFEDHFVERKTANDVKDILKTLVAFGNSTPPNMSSLLFLGVRDSGEIEDPQPDINSLDRRFAKEHEKIYPPLRCLTRIVHENDRQALAVIVPFSPSRPHFAGQSFVRMGARSVLASLEQFNELIASRNSKVSRILEYKGKTVTVMNSHRNPNGTFSESLWGNVTSVQYCDQFYVTLQTKPDIQSFELDIVTISYDHSANRLLLKLDR